MITDRQKALLLAIIEEFTDTANPVGSIDVGAKHDLHVSPATIRNEMVNLSDMGFLEKAHVSSGRKPTTMAWRWLINEGLEEYHMHPKIEVEVRTRIFRNRFQRARLVKDAVDALAENTRLPSIALTEDAIFSAGIAEILEYEEFKEIEMLQRILNILEDHSILKSIFNKHKTDQKVKVLIGEELGRNLGDCSIVFAEFGLHREERGIIGVIGPNRMRYNKVIPTVKYVSDVLTDAVDGW